MSAVPQTTATLGRGGHLTRFFFMHLGTLIAVFVYFGLAERAAYSADGVRHALHAAVLVMSGYMLVAYWRGELKYADFGLWALFAVGTGGAWAGVDPILGLFRGYSGALLFVTFGLIALAPLLLGFEPFTCYYARRSSPLWQQKLPTFAELNRVIAWFWVLVFFTAAALAAHAPRDPRYTVLYPNLLVFLVGIPAPFWLVPLYLKLFPAPLPRSAEALIMGTPFAFDRKVAGAARATIQFRVTGAEPGDYYVCVAGGKAKSFHGTAPAPELTIHTPDNVWVGIVHGELDGTKALIDGLYRVDGNLELLVRFTEWFHAPRQGNVRNGG